MHSADLRLRVHLQKPAFHPTGGEFAGRHMCILLHYLSLPGVGEGITLGPDCDGLLNHMDAPPVSEEGTAPSASCMAGDAGSGWSVTAFCICQNPGPGDLAVVKLRAAQAVIRGHDRISAEYGSQCRHRRSRVCRQAEGCRHDNCVCACSGDIDGSASSSARVPLAH